MNTCLRINGNTTSGSSASGITAPGIGLRKQGTSTSANIFRIDTLPGAPTGTPNVENYINGLNTSTSGSYGVGGADLVSATSGFSGCTSSAAQ